MILRKLKIKDAPLMYEWMTDEDVNLYFRFDPKKVTLESCKEFIKNSFTDESRTYAIDIDGEYIGSISLKDINMKDKNAEYAISLRKKYRGKGYGKEATKKILDIAFNELGLNKVYLNVLSTNKCAIELYEKIGFKYEGELINHITINNEYKSLKLYGLFKEQYIKIPKMIDFQHHGDERGNIVIAEEGKNIPFTTKRFFYIYGVNDGKSRGNHANINSEFVMAILKGSVKVKIEDATSTYEFTLDDPKKALYIPNLTWKSMYDFSEDAVLLVIANTLYDKNEYINDYEEFKKYMKEAK